MGFHLMYVNVVAVRPVLDEQLSSATLGKFAETRPWAVDGGREGLGVMGLGWRTSLRDGRLTILAGKVCANYLACLDCNACC